jgi:hypothetical protein
MTLLLITNFFRPPETWSITQRLCLALLAAGLGSVAGAQLWRSSATTEAIRRDNRIQKPLGRLQAAPHHTARPSPAEMIRQPLPNDADLLQLFSTAAVQSGVQLDVFEPNETIRSKYWLERRLHLRAHGPFSALTQFAAHLAALPWPVVPITVALHPQADHLSLTAALRIIGLVNKTSLSTPSPASTLANPFASQNASFSPVDTLQLVGLFRRGSQRTALVQFPTTTKLLKTGDTIEDEIVTRIDDTSLSLARQAHLTRTLLLHAPEQ